MRKRKALKRSLSAIICTTMLANPVMTSFAAAMPVRLQRMPEITEEYMEGKIPAEFKLWENFSGDGDELTELMPFWDFTANVSISIRTADQLESVEIETIELGDFYIDMENSLIVGLPSVIKDIYGDRSKYSVTIFVKPLDLPDYIVMADKHYPYPLEAYPFEYNNEDELKGDICFRLKTVHTQTGVISLKAPEKVKYNIGEELDLTGGRISGGGNVSSDEGTLLNWDIFGRELKEEDLDLSEFDNTKSGVYLIKAKSINFDNTLMPDEFIDNVVYDSFYVTVGDVDESISQKKTKEVKFNLNFEGEAPEDLSELEFRVDYNVEKRKNDAIWNNLGTFKADENNTITVEVPLEYFDSNKYGELSFWIDSDDLIFHNGEYYEFENKRFSYGYEKDPFEIKIEGPYDKDHYYHFGIGHAPTKLIYTVGEELDLTGGKRMGSGYTPGKTGYWDDFGSPLTLDMLDISEFDNTKPGVYTIKGKGNVSGSFKVYVYNEDEVPQSKITFEVQEFDNSGLKEKYQPYNGLKFKIKAMYQNEDGEMVELADCGVFDTKDGNTFSFEMPAKLLQQYYENRWIDFYAFPVNLPEEYKVYDGDVDFGVFHFHYGGTPEEENVIKVQRKRVMTAEGKVTVTPPTKLVYNIGEDISLEGAEITVDGTLTDEASSYKYSLSEDTRQLYLNEIDASAFDNTKPGDYTIKIVYPTVSHGADILVNNLELPEFTVTVVGEGTVGSPNVIEVNGDSNCDGTLDISDAVFIMQSIANPSKYQLTEQGKKNADRNGDGITSGDALVIQKYLLKLIDEI